MRHDVVGLVPRALRIPWNTSLVKSLEKFPEWNESNLVHFIRLYSMNIGS